MPAGRVFAGCWLALFGVGLSCVLGDRFVIAVERLMGLILVAVAVEMLLRGIKEFVLQMGPG